MSRKILFILLGLPFLLSGCVGMEVTSGRVTITDNGTHAGIVFTSSDRSRISRYFERHTIIKRTPPGLAKRQDRLPPGLVKRDRLPYGLQSRGLPGDLEKELHPLPDGYARLVIGRDLIIMKRSTREVMDIYRDVVR